MTAQDDEQQGQISIVFLGPPQKSILFEKLCMASMKHERHVSYTDVYYLTVQYESRTEMLQFTDPGLGRTGAREMAIRNADVAVLFYCANSVPSLNQLQSVKEDLERMKNLPIRLLCDLDDFVEYDEDGTSTGISSMSEGYESDPEREPRRRRRPSMEKIRQHAESSDEGIALGQQYATELGPRCVFSKISSSQYEDARNLLNELIDISTSKKRRSRSRSILPRLRNKSKENSTHPTVVEAWSTDDNSSKESRRASVVKQSKVCSVM